MDIDPQQPFTSVYTWPVLIVIIALTLLVVWRLGRKLDFRTAVMVGVGVFVALWLVLLLVAAAYGAGYRSATDGAAPAHGPPVGVGALRPH